MRRALWRVALRRALWRVALRRRVALGRALLRVAAALGRGDDDDLWLVAAAAEEAAAAAGERVQRVRGPPAAGLLAAEEAAEGRLGLGLGLLPLGLLGLLLRGLGRLELLGFCAGRWKEGKSQLGCWVERGRAGARTVQVHVDAVLVEVDLAEDALERGALVGDLEAPICLRHGGGEDREAEGCEGELHCGWCEEG